MKERSTRLKAIVTVDVWGTHEQESEFGAHEIRKAELTLTETLDASADVRAAMERLTDLVVTAAARASGSA